ncbi:MAG TPA: hypothetical protein VKO63_07750 [Chitinispirillaceae bacterium]|nr:hypothetical protein [Chitinispirillaceae bacterium]
MLRSSCLVVAFGWAALFAANSNVTLSGTVKDSDGKAVAGAVVSLEKLTSAPKDTTDTQGAFSIISTSVAVPSAVLKQEMLRLSLKNGAIQFTTSFKVDNGDISIFSGNGRLAGYMSHNNMESGAYTKTLPQLAPGSYVMNITLDQVTVVKKLINTGSGMCLSGDEETSMRSSTITTAAAAAAVDSLVVTKSGYSTAKIGIDSYEKTGIAVVLNANTVTCPTPKLPAATAITYSNKKHPSPWDFKFMDLPRVSTMAQWECRKQEILQMAQDYLYGHMPPKCEVTGTVSGGKITAACKYNGKSVNVTVSASGSGDILVLCFGGMGCATISGSRSATVSGADFLTAAKSLYGNTDMGICMASAWGVGVIIDALEQNPTCGISAKKVVTTGCSTNGKQALFAGVFEPRVGLCAPVESGAAGACSWRVSSEYGHGNSNTDCQDITHLETNWLGTVASPWTTGKPTIDHLPLDQGEIMALRAPYPMISFDNGKEQYKWLCNKGNTAAAQGCHWIYKALGVEDNFGFYQANAGHGHCSWPNEATPPLNAFVDKFLKGNSSANTHIFNYNKESMDTQKWFDFGTAKEQWDTTLVLK